MSEIKARFISEKVPEINENTRFHSLKITKEQMKTVLRGKQRELPNNGYQKGDFLILSNEQAVPRCIVQITKTLENAVYFRTVYKYKGEKND